MPDLIIIDQDQVNFLPSFGAAIIVPIPGTITASGDASFGSKKLCIDGDEKSGFAGLRRRSTETVESQPGGSGLREKPQPTLRG